MKQSTIETKLYCPHCGTIHSIFRKTCKQKKAGHYKKFYCYKCRDTHNHIELKDCLYSEKELQEMVEVMKKEGKY